MERLGLDLYLDYPLLLLHLLLLLLQQALFLCDTSSSSLRRTIRLPDQLATLVTDVTDEKGLHDLRLVFPELLEKFLLHFGTV